MNQPPSFPQNPESNSPPPARSSALIIGFASLVISLILLGVGYSYYLHRQFLVRLAQVQAQAQATHSSQETPSPVPSVLPSGSPSPGPSPTVAAPPSPAPLDLTVDAEGLSRSSVVIATERGVIRFRLYANDAPNTIHRLLELIGKGFYNGLTFHSVKPDFVVQGGDPTGTGRGGSGVKLKPEFNSRHHLEGTVAMGRTSDPNSADSQFYIALRALPQLDNNYTVIGQIVEGLDVVHKLQPGDKMLSVTIQ